MGHARKTEQSETPDTPESQDEPLSTSSLRFFQTVSQIVGTAPAIWAGAG
jgi:hypothetical protein